VIASNYGQLHHPAWYYNLLANPEAEINVEGMTRRVVARETEGEERRRLWRRGLEVYPGWSGYERRTGGRSIPVMALSPDGNQGTADRNGR
jgi:deazaflavin-dependent oxidoreductase (nitroreductase family)